MGTKGESGIERVFFGSTTLTAIKHLSCPVIVVPPGKKYSSIKKIGFACDFRQVVHTTPTRFIKDFVKEFNAELHVLNVDFRNSRSNSETPEQSLLLHTMLEDLNPKYEFIEDENIEVGIEKFAQLNNLDLVITIPKKHKLLEGLFRKSHTKELVFHSQKRGVLDHGAYYAQKTQQDAKGNRILWGWIPENRPDSELIAAGWAGCMALPRVLSLAADNSLQMSFAPQVESLRYRTLQRFRTSGNSPDEGNQVAQFEFRQIRGELLCKVTEWPFRLTLEDRAGTWLAVNCAEEGSALKLAVGNLSASLPNEKNSPKNFHLILDASVAELIFNNQHVFTARIYRTPDGPLKISVANSDLPKLESYKFWTLHPISGDRLTT